MYGLGAALAGGGQDLLPHQIALTRRGGADEDGLVGLHHMRCAGIGLGIDRDGSDAQPPGGSDDAPGDLAAIGDQQRSDHPPTS